MHSVQSVTEGRREVLSKLRWNLIGLQMYKNGLILHNIHAVHRTGTTGTFLGEFVSVYHTLTFYHTLFIKLDVLFVLIRFPTTRSHYDALWNILIQQIIFFCLSRIKRLSFNLSLELKEWSLFDNRLKCKLARPPVVGWLNSGLVQKSGSFIFLVFVYPGPEKIYSSFPNGNLKIRTLC